MSVLILARLQFYFTIGFHYIFPPMTIGLAWIIFYIMTRYKNTGDKLYESMAKFWINIFALGFVVGVATGIPLEFQFGTNWSEYSRYVGDIFGAPLAAEGVLAFFLESTFLGLLVFGWKRLSVKTHWISSLMVAIGSTLSAFWIIVANSWQQTPAGYKIENGRAVLTDFWAAVFNPSTLERYFHVMGGALATGAFVMLSISAYYLIKKQHQEFAQKSFKIALVVAFIASWGQLFIGHFHGIQVWKTQPLKLAAFEGHFETQANAPFLIFGIPNAAAERTDFAIRIPSVLSIAVAGSTDTVVKGLKDFPRDEWPPLLITFASFHSMVGLGMLMIGLTTLGLILWRMDKLFNYKLILYAFIPGFLYPTFANHFGWVATEVGRQPWIVYGLLKTSQGVSVVVPAYQIALSLLIFIGIYGLLGYTFFFLLFRKIKKGPEPITALQAEEVLS
ncbi:cytochrome ubiquinol oxidase subunit I [candidate division CSSED10-310 bacterium]|uniref:Cytochrome ubiquinol oxidase subunit I n=1 Tax=candidate division CSSED10-310 bacterium TaxID=2855610 RepID=A0ABV6Z4P6_UNCC1